MEQIKAHNEKERRTIKSLRHELRKRREPDKESQQEYSPTMEAVYIYIYIYPNFKNQESVVLLLRVVKVLCKGGYRDLEAELKFFFSDSNKIEVDDKEKDALVKSCLVR